MVGYGRILLPLELILLYLLFPSLILFGLASLEDRWVLWFLTGVYVLATLLVVRPRKQDLGLSRPHILGRVLLIAASIGAVGALWWNWLHSTNDHEGLFTAALVFVFYPGLSVPLQEFFLGHPVNGEVGTWLAPSGSQIRSPFACPYSRLQ